MDERRLGRRIVVRHLWKQNLSDVESRRDMDMNAAAGGEKTAGVRISVSDCCYDDFDTSHSDETTNVPSFSSCCSTPTSLPASTSSSTSRGPPSETHEEMRGDTEEEERRQGKCDDGSVRTRGQKTGRRTRSLSEEVNRCLVKKKKRSQVSYKKSKTAIVTEASDKSSE